MTLRGVYSNGTVNHNNDTKKLLFFGYCTSFFEREQYNPGRSIVDFHSELRCLRLLSKLRTLIVVFAFSTMTPFFLVHISQAVALIWAYMNPLDLNFQIHKYTKKNTIEPQWSGLTNGRISLPESPSCHQITPTNPFCQEQDENPRVPLPLFCTTYPLYIP